MRENALQSQCINWLNSQKIYYLNTWGNARERRGRPDLIICFQGRFIGCELKKEGQKPVPLQLKHLKEIKKNGGVGVWITSLEQLKSLISSLTSKINS